MTRRVWRLVAIGEFGGMTSRSRTDRSVTLNSFSRRSRMFSWTTMFNSSSMISTVPGSDPTPSTETKA